MTITASTRRSSASRRRGGHSRATLVGLAALSVIPLVAGTLRLSQLAGGPNLLPVDPRFTSSALPLVTHIVSSLVFALVGALQFVPRLRRRASGWHRRAGRVVASAGLFAASSALWLTLFYPPHPGTGELLFVLRLVFATAMIGCLALGIATVRRRDFAGHRAWMIRTYAIGMAAGTQVLTEGFSKALFGSGVLLDDLAKAMGWVINLAVAEWIIRRSGLRPRHSAPDRVTSHD